ncbi:TonB-dependent receptor [Flavisphingomonas formosensis]|uniref:TonB-dependent receptor n=1 Tax=Flavisphingomonas formosensis TaxID=861534 RepID=UPI0012F77639|nr:TonB-dependent receptor [Sphingomonas formosensis]
MKLGWLLPAVWALGSAQAVAQAGADVDGRPSDPGDIIVTATRRSETLASVPLAISVVGGETLARSGVVDLRQLIQLSPSLLVSSTQSEAAAAQARIRGIGTVGDNPGLESSVALFIDGVYRSRTGMGLSELGAIDRIEVLRGPQGTLFGRNASAGLIHVITAKPQSTTGGMAEFGYGNHHQYRGQIGLTGPVTDRLAYRIDGVWTRRDGFIRDTVSGRDVNGRNRWLARGQLLFQPDDALSIRIIGDYARRNEECCAAVYLPARDVRPSPGGGISFAPSTILGIERALGAHIDDDDPFARKTALTPGLGYPSRTRDWGLSGEIGYRFGAATLTAITAYRDWRYRRGQDADFNDLDLIRRDDDGGNSQRFRTFTQEMRLQGKALHGHLDFLLGGYYAHERLGLRDNLGYGADYQRFADCLIASGLAGQIGVPGLVSPGGTGCISTETAGALAGNPALPPQLRQTVALLAGLAPGVPAGGYGAIAAALGLPGSGFAGRREEDRYSQRSDSFAVFTHDVIALTDRLSLTLGARYTHERKTLDATLTDDNELCRAIAGSPFSGFALPACGALPSVPGGSLSGRTHRRETQWSGNAVLSYRPTSRLMVYLSYARGYKAGGFDLDRSNLPRLAGGAGPVAPTATLVDLAFAPEKVQAYEAGLKYSRPGIDLNVALFRELFRNFQLNAFNGLSFDVVNIQSCSAALAPGSACPSGKRRSGVRSQGMEVEALLRPTRLVTVNFGLTYADARYRRNLVDADGRPLSPALFQLPGRRLSSAPAWTATGGAGWTPALGRGGLSGLLYADIRYQGRMNSGSDLDLEKVQGGVATVNARLGVHGRADRWALELWAQNLFDANYLQVAFDSPLQGQGSIRATRATGMVSTGVFNAFLADPRTFGVTLRTLF